VPAPSSYRLPSAARRALPAGAGRRHDSAPSSGVTNGRSPVQASLRRPAANRTRRAIERAVGPSQPSWRCFRPGAAWFHREMDGLARRRPLSPGARLRSSTGTPCGHPVVHALFHRSQCHPVESLVLPRTPQSSAPATALILGRDRSPTSAAGLRFVPLHEAARGGGLRSGPSARRKCASASCSIGSAAVEESKPRHWRPIPELKRAEALDRAGPASWPSSNRPAWRRPFSQRRRPALLAAPRTRPAAPGHRAGAGLGGTQGIPAPGLREAAALHPQGHPASGDFTPAPLVGSSASLAAEVHVRARAFSVIGAGCAVKPRLPPSIPA